jgi:3-hydroxyacyl-[acyl-carrier-protein] dehydratase
MSENKYRLSVDQIRKFLPHRYPFLLVDRILEIHPAGDVSDPTPGAAKIGTRVIGRKSISFNENCFQGHFPEFSIFPGVLIIESMAFYPYIEKNLEKIAKDLQCILVGVDNVRFRKPVVPGDVMQTEAVVTKCRGRIWAFQVVATVDGERVAEADLLANLILKGDSA